MLSRLSEDRAQEVGQSSAGGVTYHQKAESHGYGRSVASDIRRISVRTDDL